MALVWKLCQNTDIIVYLRVGLITTSIYKTLFIKRIHHFLLTCDVFDLPETPPGASVSMCRNVQRNRLMMWRRVNASQRSHTTTGLRTGTVISKNYEKVKNLSNQPNYSGPSCHTPWTSKGSQTHFSHLPENLPKFALFLTNVVTFFSRCHGNGHLEWSCTKTWLLQKERLSQRKKRKKKKKHLISHC